jgi:hypothetical protein
MRQYPGQRAEGKNVAAMAEAPTATVDHSDPGKMLANTAASPDTIAAIAPRLCESITTITTTARTIVSMIGRAMGRPFAASGAARKIRQS